MPSALSAQLCVLSCGDGHAVLLFAQLLRFYGTALALSQPGQILHSRPVVHQRLYRTRAVQLLQGAQRLDNGNGAGVTHSFSQSAFCWKWLITSEWT